MADPITTGMLIPVVIGGIAAAIRGVAWLYEKQEEAAAVTPEQKRDIVIKRLIRSYEQERHPAPIQAACDHLSGMED